MPVYSQSCCARASERKKSDPLLKQDEANKIEALINNSSMEIHEVLKKPVKVKPKAPFITSTLQQAASTKLSFNVKRTMRVAQKLYEAEQKLLAEESKLKVDNSRIFTNPIVTEITKLDKFWPAEDYHNDYYANNMNQPYCSLTNTKLPP